MGLDWYWVHVGRGRRMRAHRSATRVSVVYAPRSKRKLRKCYENICPCYLVLSAFFTHGLVLHWKLYRNQVFFFVKKLEYIHFSWISFNESIIASVNALQYFAVLKSFIYRSVNYLSRHRKMCVWKKSIEIISLPLTFNLLNVVQVTWYKHLHTCSILILQIDFFFSYKIVHEGCYVLNISRDVCDCVCSTKRS